MEKIIEWLSEHDLLSIHRLEERAGIPHGVLAKALKGDRPLPEKYIEPLARILREYGYALVENSP